MNQSFDYLIVGQGLAGSLLAYQLLEIGKKIKIIDNENGASSSKVAAGIFNPITGKRFVKTWLCDDIFNEIIPFYKGLEAKFGVKFLHKMPIARPVETVREQNFVIDLADDPAHTNYLEFLPKNPEINNLVKADYGILSTKISGWLDIPVLLNNLKNYFSDRGIYNNQVFDYKAVKFSNNKAEYQGCIYDKIIFCEGYSMVQNPFFNWLPFNAVKGELLDVKMEAPLHNFILLKGIFILPIAGHNFKVGATYNWGR